MSQFWCGVVATVTVLILVNVLMATVLWWRDRRDDSMTWERFERSLTEEEIP